jgi:sialate O-acetylesterase
MKALISALFACGLLAALASTARADVKLPALVGDNMVVQQGVKVRVWGWAEPGERVAVAMAGKVASAVTDAKGKWEVWIGPYEAGGPHGMSISGKNTITLRNVLVGEVWVGSGQSNMEWQLQNAMNGAAEIAKANHPEIRFFTVTKKTSPTPLDDVEGRWVVCSPETAGSFSAVAYFFGREIHQELKVPVGLIHSSWGGTPAEAWTSRPALAASPDFKPMVDALDSSAKGQPEARREYEAALAKWEEEHFLQDTGNADTGRAKPDFSDAGWKTMKLPQLWESAGLDIDGSVWFRKTVDLPADWAGKDLALSLGPIDDFDTTYFNGTKVGAIGRETPNFYLAPRKYTVPGSAVRAGRNVIAVRAFDHVGGGGFGGSSADMTLAPAGAAAADPISLAGEWRYDIENGVASRNVDFGTQPVAPPGVNNPNSPTVLYNAMLAPLTSYTIRGAIWYQGEANANRGRQYRTLFPTMIRDWRSAWGAGDFPFLFVQLANWQPRKAEPSESGWAELREAQLMTLKEPATGMAVVIDIGEADDIHPRNKHDVGHRLAVWALAKTYGKKLEYSGPLYESFKVEGKEARIRFSHADGLRAMNGDEPVGFAVAGSDKKFVWAKAKIEGDTVVVWSDAVAKPEAVRYAWADNPAANLYNGAGLPASPFRTDAW